MIEAEAGKTTVLEDTLKAPWLLAVCNSAPVKRFVNEIQQQTMRRSQVGNEMDR
jgi:hypothetical protein